jgi:hypothetical protein
MISLTQTAQQVKLPQLPEPIQAGGDVIFKNRVA